jgi:hypothetical protein
MGHKNKDNDSSASASSSSSDVSEKKSKKPKKEKAEKSSKKDKSKKKDKKESKKRGPRGAQWMTWKIPFQESSVLGQSFQQAAHKGGVELKKLEKEIKKAGGTPAFIIRLLKRGHNRGWKWDVDDSHGRLRVLNSKLDKKFKKAA